MNYSHALAERRRAVAACRAARGELRDAVDDAIGAYQAHPLPALVGAAGVGFVLAQLRVGSGLVRTGMRIASGPAWTLVRQYLWVP
ncbi:MAG: hypothetical protein J0H27_15710 [Xanthomonadales bacterium]|nr:hypothetical protein [Xanthomonadales bacterium]ODV26094.1 MAG: hypothetical protein ABT19_03170 [Rhodanobacter sp. SCN 68-63]OJY85373.1 MAG: hypothetical protein BGP23_00015 [Xanthomonadales bacterium 66-474]